MLNCEENIAGVSNLDLKRNEQWCQALCEHRRCAPSSDHHKPGRRHMYVDNEVEVVAELPLFWINKCSPIIVCIILKFHVNWRKYKSILPDFTFCSKSPFVLVSSNPSKSRESLTSTTTTYWSVLHLLKSISRKNCCE